MSTSLVVARLLLTATGVLVWGYGHRYDIATARLVAIAILAIAFLLRFVPTRSTSDEE